MSDPGNLFCRYCRQPTPWATLADFGARCRRCYEGYLRAVPEVPPMADKNADPKGWARVLKARHDGGERLTPAQVAMYRAVTDRNAPAITEEAA